MERRNLNLGAAVLAIIKSKGNRGAFSDEITRSILRLRQNFDLEAVTLRPGPTGPDSDRIRSLVGVFVVRGFLKEDSPAKLTKEGEKWMNDQLRAYFKDGRRLEEFWARVG